MVKLARNEQCITLYPLTAHYSVGPFPAHVIFRPSRGPFILGLISTFVYLRPVTVIFCLWVKVSPWLQSARLWPVNTLGRFDSVIKIWPINDGPLWSAHERTIMVGPLWFGSLERPRRGASSGGCGRGWGGRSRRRRWQVRWPELWVRAGRGHRGREGWLRGSPSS